MGEVSGTVNAYRCPDCGAPTVTVYGKRPPLNLDGSHHHCTPTERAPMDHKAEFAVLILGITGAPNIPAAWLLTDVEIGPQSLDYEKVVPVDVDDEALAVIFARAAALTEAKAQARRGIQRAVDAENRVAVNLLRKLVAELAETTLSPFEVIEAHVNDPGWRVAWGWIADRVDVARWDPDCSTATAVIRGFIGDIDPE